MKPKCALPMLHFCAVVTLSHCLLNGAETNLAEASYHTPKLLDTLYGFRGTKFGSNPSGLKQVEAHPADLSKAIDEDFYKFISFTSYTNSGRPDSLSFFGKPLNFIAYHFANNKLYEVVFIGTYDELPELWKHRSYMGGAFIVPLTDLFGRATDRTERKGSDESLMGEKIVWKGSQVTLTLDISYFPRINSIARCQLVASDIYDELMHQYQVHRAKERLKHKDGI